MEGRCATYSDGDAADSGPASTLSMNTGFALQQGAAEFPAVADVVEDSQQQLETPPASPATSLAMESIEAFLNEIGQFNEYEDFPSTDAHRVQDQTATQMCMASAVYKTAGARTTDSPKPNTKKKTRKKTVSSLERSRREKAFLLHSIDQMEQTIRLLQRHQYDKIADIFSKRWKHRFLYEIRQRRRLEAEKLRLRERVNAEHHRSDAVFKWIRASLQATAAFTRVPFETSFSFDKDSAIFHALAWSVHTKLHVLNHVPPMRSADSEMSNGRLSADGAVAEYAFVHFVPFDVQTVTEIGWQCTKAYFGSTDAGHQEPFAAETLVIKQELELPAASCQEVKLRVLAVCKQIVSQGRTTLIWEGLCKWLTPTATISSATHEHGSITVQPVQSAADGSVVSAVRCCAQLKFFNSNDMALHHLLRNSSVLSEIVLPSFQKLMDARYQHVENSLLSSVPRSSV